MRRARLRDDLRSSRSGRGAAEPLSQPRRRASGVDLAFAECSSRQHGVRFQLRALGGLPSDAVDPRQATWAHAGLLVYVDPSQDPVGRLAGFPTLRYAAFVKTDTDRAGLTPGRFSASRGACLKTCSACRTECARRRPRAIGAPGDRLSDATRTYPGPYPTDRARFRLIDGLVRSIAWIRRVASRCRRRPTRVHLADRPSDPAAAPRRSSGEERCEIWSTCGGRRRPLVDRRRGRGCRVRPRRRPERSAGVPVVRCSDARIRGPRS